MQNLQHPSWRVYFYNASTPHIALSMTVVIRRMVGYAFGDKLSSLTIYSLLYLSFVESLVSSVENQFFSKHDTSSCNLYLQ